MNRTVEFTPAEIATLLIAMNAENIRAKGTDSSTLKKHVSELREKMAREYMAATGSTDQL